MRLGKKVEAGAEFVQTQICFNLDAMALFLSRIGDLGLLDHVWVLAGVFVLRSARAAHYLRDRVPGIDVPEHVVDRMEGVPAERQADEGVAIALETIERLRGMPGVSGVHLMSIRGTQEIVRVVSEAGLLPRPAAMETAVAG